MTPAGSLACFHDPEAVTVVGASEDPAKWGFWMARGALRGAHRRAVNLVNRRGVEILGRRTVASLGEVEGPLGLVVLCVPAYDLVGVVREALDRGASGFVGITAGLDHALGRPGAERELAAEIRERGARLVGPNCLGVYDAATDLQLAWGEFVPGQLAIVSQSGQLGSELADLAAARGLGVSRFVSVGNQVDVTATEVLADLVDHDATSVVALYLEGFGDGRELLESLRRLRSAGKPTLLLTVGDSAASQQAAASHTGSLTSGTDLVEAACRAAGAVRVQTPAQLVTAAQTLVAAPAIPGRRVAIVGDSGGQGALAADVVARAGLDVPRLGVEQRAQLAAVLPTGAAVSNPVDLAGGGEADLAVYAEVVEALLTDDDVDAVLLTGYFGSYGRLTPSLQEQEGAVAQRLALLADKHGKPVVVHGMGGSSETIDLLRSQGVPVHAAVEDAVLGLGVGAHLSEHPGRPVRSVADVSDATWGTGYLAAREVLASAGVRFPRAEAITDSLQLEGATRRLAAPYVLKADWIAHKTEHRAVAVNLPDLAAVQAAHADMTARLGNGRYVLEEMDVRPDVVELIVGARRDPSFGPTVMVGTGGVQAELFRDTCLELGPVGLATATDMVRRLRGHALLAGWRGRPAVDIDALAELVVAVSRLLAEAPIEVSDIELNPVRVGTDGALAVDALIHHAHIHHTSEELS